MRRNFGLFFLASCACLCLPASSAFASHFRGVDASANIDAAGVVTLTATTRWRKGTLTDPLFDAGVNPARFGLTEFVCPFDGQLYPLTPATGMRVVMVPGGATVYSWTGTEFTQAGTTVSVDTSNFAYDERVQVLLIPLGATAAAGQIVPPLNLPSGDYDIRWNDWSRISGIQNIEPTVACTTGDGGFGFHIRVRWNGTANHGPSFASGVVPIVARGFDYSHNLNANDTDGDSLAYTFAPLNPAYPDFGPATQVPGLTLAQTGQLSIPAASTTGLLDNFFGEPAGDYMFKVRVADTRGFISERDALLDAVTSTNDPPVLAPIGNRAIYATLPAVFVVTATDPDPGQMLTLASRGLPAGASFDPATGVFTWTPAASQTGSHGIDFTVTDSGTAEAAFQDLLTDSETVTIVVQSLDGNRPPVLEEIANETVGADPANVEAFVAQTLTFDARASDVNAGDILVYSLPVLLRPDGTVGALADLGASIVQAIDGQDRQIGRVTVIPDAGDVGVWNLRVRVDDGFGGSDEENVFITVGTFPNKSPVFTTLPPFEVFAVEGSPVSFSIAAADPDSANAVTLTVSGAPGGSSFTAGAPGNPTSGSFTWMPAAGQGGIDYIVYFEATDNGSPAISERVQTTVHVATPGAAPINIVKITPNRGTSLGGTPVTVNGQGFTGATGATIGGNAVTNFTVVDSVTLTFDTPSCTGVDCESPAGAVRDVVVISPGGSATLSGGYLYFQSPAGQVDDLIALVQSLPLASGPKKALTNQLQAARAAIDAGDQPAACELLQEFLELVNAFQRAKKLTVIQAAQLIDAAIPILADLGC